MAAKKNRGFVILIVLAVAAVIGAIVASQLTTGKEAQITSTREQEEARARAAAEACLDMMTAYVDKFMPDDPAARTPPPVGPDDFDKLLAGPDGTANNADDFTPGLAGGTLIKLPKGTVSTLNNWELERNINGTKASCIIRLEDNSDDGRPDPVGVVGQPSDPACCFGTGACPGPTCFCESAAGNQPDIPNCDRDSSIYVSVIGVFPDLGAPAADVYANAHARVTLRRLIQKPNVISPLAPGLWAGNTVAMHDKNDVCGAGGVQAGTVDIDKKSCVCGAETCGTTCTGSLGEKNGDSCSCPSGCQPYQKNPPPQAVPLPPANIHWGNVLAGGYRDIEALGAPKRVDPKPDPASAPNPPGTSGQNSPIAAPTITAGVTGGGYNLSNGGAKAPFCSFFGMGSTPTGSGVNQSHFLFAWDSYDTNTLNTISDLADDGLANGSAGIAQLGVVAEDCTVPHPTTASIPRPCTWHIKQVGAPDTAHVVECSAGESACWRPIALLNDGGEDKSIGVDAAGLVKEWTDNGGDQGWQPHKGTEIPNFSRDVATHSVVTVYGDNTTGLAQAIMAGLGLAAAPSARVLCGDVPAKNCSACTTASPDFPPSNNAGLPGLAMHTSSGDHWHFEGANNANMPSPMVFIGEAMAGSDRNIHFKDDGAGGANNGPFRATTITDGSVFVEGSNMALCSATMDCSAVAGIVNISNNCQKDSLFGGSPSPEIAATPNGLVAKNPGNYNYSTANLSQLGGTAIKAAGMIFVKDSAVVIGDIRGGGIYTHDNACIVGSAIGYDPTLSTTPLDGTCGAAPCNAPPPNVCTHNSSHIIGDLMSMGTIENHDNTLVWGNVIAKVSACFHDGTGIDGVVQAGTDIDFHDNATIVNTGQAFGTGAGTQTVNPALKTYLEATW